MSADAGPSCILPPDLEKAEFIYDFAQKD